MIISLVYYAYVFMYIAMLFLVCFCLPPNTSQKTTQKRQKEGKPGLYWATLCLHKYNISMLQSFPASIPKVTTHLLHHVFKKSMECFPKTQVSKLRANHVNIGGMVHTAAWDGRNSNSVYKLWYDFKVATKNTKQQKPSTNIILLWKLTVLLYTQERQSTFCCFLLC